jgi:hypothetical protein
MQSPRAPLYVFFAAFLTFLIAFATLLAVLKPELDKRRAAEQGASGPPASGGTDGTTSVASLAPSSRSDRGAPARDGRKDGRKPSKSASVPVDVSGRVVDPRGSPMGQAQVHVLISSRGKGDSAAWPLVSKPVNKDGSFSFRASIPPTGAFLVATTAGYARSDTRSLSPSGSPVDVGNLALKPGGQLRVRVSGDEVGKLSGADVTLVPSRSGPADLAPAEVAGRTGGDGVALLRGIDRGSFRVVARAEGHADAEAEWRFDGSGRSGTEEVSLVLLPLCAYVSGNALDLDRRPVTKGEVAVRWAQGDPPSDQEWRGPIDSHGQFRVGPLPRGTFKVQIVAPGMVQNTEIFAEADGESVELTVEHGGSVVGRLATTVAQLSQPARITVWKVDGSGRTQPVEGAYHAEAIKNSLKFRVDGLGPGRYYVRAAANGFAPGRSATFSLSAGGTHEEVVVPLGAGGSLAATLVDARGAPLGEARVTAFEGTAPPPPALVELFPADARTSTNADSDGRFEFASLSPGPVVLVIEAMGQAARTLGPLLVGEDEETSLGPLTVGGGAILSATVANARGDPLPFGSGLLVSNDGLVRVPFSADEDGNFCLRGVAPGDYVVSALDGRTGRTEVTLRPNETGRVQFFAEKR